MLRLALALALVPASRACTSILLGPGATDDGTVWVGQSDDGEGAGDARVVYVPAASYPAGAMRPVFDYEDYPRYVGTERKIPAYYPSSALPNATGNVIGYVPQVARTFGYLEADYAISNDQGLAFGESTVSARIFTKPVHQGGPALLSMYELSRLAAERCATAVCAVETMGAMAERYGFWGDASHDTGGESLLVADTASQWIFHVLPADEEKGGAVWCGQRIPSNHAAIVANAFVIGDVDPTRPDTFKFSKNMEAVAEARGFWDGEGLLHFTRAFSAGEYSSHAYAGRRMWAFWSVVAPSLGVGPEYESYLAAVGGHFPVSARADAGGVSRADLFSRIYRNYYQGTEYDLGAGPAGGPFGTPVRIKPGPGEAAVAGACGSDGSPCEAWERSIASFRSTSIHLTNLGATRGPANVAWFLPAAALSGFFFPVVVADERVPAPLADVDNRRVDRTKSFWAFRELAQFAYPRWDLVKGEIYTLQADLEAAAADAVAAGARPSAAAGVAKWRDLYDALLVRDSDGWAYDTKAKVANRVGYPAAWLDEVGYEKGTTYACKTTCP